MFKIQGLYTAIVSPFKSDGTFDSERFRQLLRFQIAAGVNGITILGTTGEAPTLTHKEKELEIAIAREETRGKAALMVGTGSYSTAQTIESTLEAKALGADSALIVTPYYNRPTQEGIYLHFKAIAAATDIPIVVYNHQGRTGQNIETETLYKISQLPRIAGVKDSSGNLQQMVDVVDKIKRVNPDFILMSGDDQLTLPCMAMGGSGIISVIGNIIPLQMQKLIYAMQQNQLSVARKWHYDLLPLFRLSALETNPIPLKAAMAYTNFSAGGCRLPLCPLSKESVKKMEAILSEESIKNFIQENELLFKKQLNIKNALDLRDAQVAKV